MVILDYSRIECTVWPLGLVEKSLHSQGYRAMLRLLRKTRQSVGVTQEELATRLDETQTFISKCERGERRIDVIELRKFCEALGIPLSKFVRDLERVLSP